MGSLLFSVLHRQAGTIFTDLCRSCSQFHCQAQLMHKVGDQQMLPWIQFLEDRNAHWHCIGTFHVPPTWGLLTGDRGCQVQSESAGEFLQTTQADSVECSQKLLRTLWNDPCSLLTNPHPGWELSKNLPVQATSWRTFYLLIFVLMKPHKTSHGWIFITFEV